MLPCVPVCVMFISLAGPLTKAEHYELYNTFHKSESHSQIEYLRRLGYFDPIWMEFVVDDLRANSVYERGNTVHVEMTLLIASYITDRPPDEVYARAIAGLSHDVKEGEGSSLRNTAVRFYRRCARDEDIVPLAKLLLKFEVGITTDHYRIVAILRERGTSEALPILEVAIKTKHMHEHPDLLDFIAEAKAAILKRAEAKKKLADLKAKPAGK